MTLCRGHEVDRAMPVLFVVPLHKHADPLLSKVTDRDGLFSVEGQIV